MSTAEMKTDAITDLRTLPIPKRILLGAQQAFSMFGSTVLVPILTGLDIATCLFLGGVATLLFHLISKNKVPVYMGSSFAFITPILSVAAMMGGGAEGLAYARGGMIMVGVVYLLAAVLVGVFGSDTILKLFPPVVAGSMILSIGLSLAPVAVDMASGNWPLAFAGIIVVILVSVFAKGFLSVIPILCALVIGYVISMVTGLVDFSVIAAAPWVGLPAFSLPKFSLSAILVLVPVAIAPLVEHVGDISAVGAIVNKDFIKDPGLHRTLAGDGVGIIASTMFGGTAVTTYSENTGVLALTRVWDAAVMRIAAVVAIVLGLCPKISAIIQTIPSPLLGGISIILFGMIASTGLRYLMENKVDFGTTRNQIIFALILVLTIGGAAISFTVGSVVIEFAGLGLSAIVGVVLNLILPKPKKTEESKAE